MIEWSLTPLQAESAQSAREWIIDQKCQTPMINLFLKTKFPLAVSISVKITAIYFAVGILWIFFSDAALGLIVRDPSLMTKLSIAKGCCYVSLTALMLYVLVRRGTVEIERSRLNIAEAVTRERQRLLEVIETLPIMVCLLKPDYKVAFVNRSYRDKYGEAHGRPCYEYRFGNSEPCSFCETTEVLKTGLPHHWEFTCPDGREIDAHDFPFTDVDGSPMILELHIDITERKRAEEALRRSEIYLTEAQRLSRSGSWALDVASGKYDYWSEETFRIHEFDPQEGLPTKEAVYRRIHPEDWNRTEESFQKSIREKVDTLDEFRIVLPSGTVKHIQVIRHPVLNDAGDVVQLVGTTMDITERKLAEEALQNLLAELELRVEERTKELSEANQSLQVANRELDSFSYSVAHDLRAPLRAIDGFSMMVLKDYADKLDDEGRRKLNVIRSNTQQMGRLIDDLLTFSRLGRKEMANASLDMEAIVRSVWRELSHVNPGRRIQFSVQRLPHGMGDQTLVKEVVLNLLSNAIKFTKYRKNAIVEVGACPEKETNVYFVKDNGAGFDMQYYDKLFGVFQRLHSADEFEGTGVGLAIVERIIGRHGGRVWAEGKEGEGATFYFTLPRRGDG